MKLFIALALLFAVAAPTGNALAQTVRVAVPGLKVAVGDNHRGGRSSQVRRKSDAYRVVRVCHRQKGRDHRYHRVCKDVRQLIVPNAHATSRHGDHR